MKIQILANLLKNHSNLIDTSSISSAIKQSFAYRENK